MLQLYDRIFPADWMRRGMGEPADVRRRFLKVDPGELWETHYSLKNLLLQFGAVAGEPAMPTPRRERRSGRNGPQPARP